MQLSIDQKLAQMYRAMGDLNLAERLPSIKPEVRPSAGRFSISIDFTTGADMASAANKAYQLIANIACLKDHLKVWCSKRGKPFSGERLIDSDRDVAIVHDLWNLDKHGNLRESRSALYPRLASPPSTSLVMRVEPNGQPPMVNIPFFGAPIQASKGVTLRVVAIVEDKDGNVLGNLEEICQRAIVAWETELKAAGVFS